jgi:hypothetical protein
MFRVGELSGELSAPENVGTGFAAARDARTD